jgi:phosphonate degradation associated HDIG domain protein
VTAVVAGSVAEVLALYEWWGPERYDEEVTQLEHALQTAALAKAAGADDALVVAALLHDVGHLLELEGGRFRSDVDERHESRGASYLAALFPPSVTAPIALHVRAKRYLCAVDAGYTSALSAGSVASLAKQGGPMTRDEVTAFERQPGAKAAVELRRWDDEAKVLDLDSGTIDQHRALLDTLTS